MGETTQQESPIKILQEPLKWTLLSVLFLSCSLSPQATLEKADDLARLGKFPEALELYERVIRRNPDTDVGLKAAREAGRISLVEVKNFSKAVTFFKYIVVGSKDATERLNAQKQLALVYLNQLSEYQKATVEINKLLPLLTDVKDIESFRMALVRAYLYQNNFSQALLEADILKKTKLDAKTDFDLTVLRGNIYLAKKDVSAAGVEFRRAMALNIKDAIEENVPITLAVSLEEMRNFDEAILVLKEAQPHYKDQDYIQIRIKRLEDRKKAQPGARGKIRR